MNSVHNLCLILFLGLVCGTGEFTVCHGDIVDRISGINGYANICNNGKKEMMKVPSGFKSPREKYQVCKWEVIIDNGI